MMNDEQIQQAVGLAIMSLLAGNPDAAICIYWNKSTGVAALALGSTFRLGNPRGPYSLDDLARADQCEVSTTIGESIAFPAIQTIYGQMMICPRCDSTRIGISTVKTWRGGWLVEVPHRYCIDCGLISEKECQS